MKKHKKINLIIINIACILALILVLVPLLMISKYNYPSADDWSSSVTNYKALKNGGGLFSVLVGSLETVKSSYMTWEGRFSCSFFATLCPAIWGEKYYSIVAWIMLGSIIFSEIFLCKNLLKIKWNTNDSCAVYSHVIMIPAIILQILYSPSPKESFYWYTGSMNYTCIYSLSLILLVLFIKLGITDYSKWKYILLSVILCFLSILIGGNNFATSLSCILTLFVLSALLFFLNKKAFCRTWFLPIVMCLSLLFSIFSPGTMGRITNFSEETTGPIYAITMSLFMSIINFYSWTNIKVILMLLFILPFVWTAVKNIDYSFRFPGLFTLITFGLYSSQATPNMYIDGNTGGGRMAAILYYSYYIWIVGNFCYWTGWFSNRQNKIKKIIDIVNDKLEKYIIPYCAIIGILLVGIIYTADLREITSYQAYRNWRQGWAQQYAIEWEDRLEILHDDSIKEVEFEPLSVPGELLIMYTDLQDENGYIWVNSACARYYDKEYVHIHNVEE